MSRTLRFITCAVALSRCVASASLPEGYAVHASFALSPQADRVRGRLELLEDARITRPMRDAIRQAWGGDPCAGDVAASLRSLCATPGHAPLRPALLRLLDASGNVIATRTAERPLAEVGVARLHGDARRTFLFTVDLGVGMGSYAGPLTRLAEPTATGFGWIVARDVRGGAPDTLTLASTLKTAWDTVPGRDGRGRDLIMERCRPDFTARDTASTAFRLVLERYSFEGGRWVRRRREEPGFWESDEPMDRRRFP